MSSPSLLSVYQHPPAHRVAEAERIAAQTTLADWLHLIRAEYLEIPGLHLTKKQVQRLWSLDQAVCEELLDALVDVRFLRRTQNGAYVRADIGG